MNVSINSLYLHFILTRGIWRAENSHQVVMVSAGVESSLSIAKTIIEENASEGDNQHQAAG